MTWMQCPGCGQKVEGADPGGQPPATCPHCKQPLLASPVSPAVTAAFAQDSEEGLESIASSLPGAGTRSTSSPNLMDTVAQPSLDQVPGEAPPAAAPEGPDPQVYDFLAPAREPGELGWLGPYRVMRVLGAGGMGVVFLAEDPQLQRSVALKAMLPALAASASARQRFLREARAAAAIEHDHIVSIYQVGEDRGIPFLAMQFLHGEALDARLKREALLPLAEILRITREIAAGLAAAHKRGLIHRDIKPSNVWLERETGRVRILDFGLARDTRENANLTQSGSILGTPAYMAPEQATGQPLDARCDLFSLGCVLYQLATGQLPFHKPDPFSTLMAVVTEEPRPPAEVNPSLPPALAELILRLLAKKPAERPAAAGEVVDQLAAISNDQTIDVASLRPAARKEIPVRKAGPVSASAGGRRALKIGLGVGLLAALGLGIWIYLENSGTGGPGKKETLVKPADKSGSGTEKGVPVPKAVTPADKPLSPLALVSRPTPIKGVASWTIETRKPRGMTLAVAFSSSWRFLALAGTDGTIRLYERRIDRLTRALVGHAGPIRALAWLPDKDRFILASAGDDRTIRIWDVEAGRLLHTLAGHEGIITALGWLNATTLASSSVDKTVRVWQVGSPQPPRILRGPVHAPWAAVSWSPDGKVLATASAVNTVDLWRADNGNFLRSLKGSPDHVDLLAWSPDSKLLATGGRGPVVRLWQVETGKVSQEIPGQAEGVRALAWSSEGRTLALAAPDGTVTLWDVSGPKPQERTRLPEPQEGIQTLAWANNPANPILACSCRTGVLSTWKAPWHKPIRSETSLAAPEMLTLVWSGDGTKVATLERGGAVRLWEVKAGKMLHTLKGSDQERAALAWSPDGTKIAVPEGKKLVLYDGASGKPLTTLTGYTDSLLTAAWSPDGKQVTSSTRSGPQAKVLIHDAATGQLRDTLLVRIPAWALAWSPDGKELATNGGSISQVKRKGVLVRVWDVRRGRVVRLMGDPQASPGAVSVIRALAWSPDGKLLASGGRDGAIRLWLPDGKLAALFPGQGARVQGLFWLSREKFAAEYAGHVVRFWEVDKDKPLGQWNTMGRGAISPNGQLWAALVPGNALRFRTVAGGQTLGTVQVLRANEADLVLRLSANGHYQGAGPGFAFDQEIVYLVQTEKGQEVLTPEDFARKYHWKNDPERVRLTSLENALGTASLGAASWLAVTGPPGRKDSR